jgi:hypothetical protein
MITLLGCAFVRRWRWPNREYCRQAEGEIRAAPRPDVGSRRLAIDTSEFDAPILGVGAADSAERLGVTDALGK